MDFRKKFYEEAKKSFLQDITLSVCKEVEDQTVCINKNLKAFDVVFTALEEQLNLEQKLLRDYEVRQKEGVNYIRRIPFTENL